MTNIQFYKNAIEASGCIGNGWELVKKNYWMYFGITLLAGILVACIPCVNLFIIGPIFTGVYYVLLRDMRGERVEFGMMFKGFENFVPAMVAGLIQAIPGIIFQVVKFGLDISRGISQANSGRRGGDFGDFSSMEAMFSGVYLLFVLVYFVFSIFWGITFWFVMPLLAEHKELGAIDAIKLSARAGWSNAGGLLLLIIFEILVGLVGVIALCFGILFVLPTIIAANAFAYRQVFPSLIPTAQNNMPPTPESYGGSYGQGM